MSQLAEPACHALEILGRQDLAEPGETGKVGKSNRNLAGAGKPSRCAFGGGDSLAFEHMAYLQHQQAFNHSLERGNNGLRQRVRGLCDINLARSRFCESLEGWFAHHGSSTA